MALVNQLLLTDRTKDDSSNPHLLDANVNDCFADDDYIYIATDGGLSVLNRSSLSRAGYHQLDKKVTSVWASASYVYYATWGGGLYRVAKADINGDFSASATQFLHTGSTPSLPTDYLYKVRGYSDNAILIGHSKGVSFYNGSSVYDGYHLLADDFVDNSEGDDPAGWTVDDSAGDISVQEDPFVPDGKALKFYRDTSWVEAAKTFTAKSKILVRTFISACHTNHYIDFQIRSDSTTVTGLGLWNDGKFAYFDGSSWVSINLPYEAWRIYDLVLFLDLTTNTVDIWIDGAQFVSAGSISTAATTVNTIVLAADTSGGSATTVGYIHSVYITDATSDTFWGGPSKAVAITSSEIYYSTGSGVARKDSYPSSDWEGAVDFHYDEDSTPGLITDLPGKFEVTDLAVAEDKSSQDNTANRLVVGQRNGVTVIDEHSTPSSGVSTHYGRSDLTTSRQDKVAGYSDVVGAVALDSDGSYLFVGTREDEDPSDNFEGTVLDSLRWKDTSQNGGAVTLDDYLKLDTAAQANSKARVESRDIFEIVGDFDIQVDYENMDGGSSSSWRALVAMSAPSRSGGAYVGINQSSANPYWIFVVGGDYYTVDNASSSGKLRLVRRGETYYGYYWNNGWQQIGSPITGSSYPVLIRFYNNCSSAAVAMTITLKNFKINKGTVIWLNGKPKGAYTKIKLADNSVQEFIEGLDAKALCM